ncbi:hypothetical protein RHOW815_000349 [Candidatus Rhabdochlamydia sp. W815]|nr:hypothetical protein RHOW815_000349 [Candidatus Rhabdochlamydia sp. W815]
MKNTTGFCVLKTEKIENQCIANVPKYATAPEYDVIRVLLKPKF